MATESFADPSQGCGTGRPAMPRFRSCSAATSSRSGPGSRCLAQRPSRFIDLGAADGYYAVAIARLGIAVDAFELSPSARRDLSRLAAVNGYGSASAGVPPAAGCDTCHWMAPLCCRTARGLRPGYSIHPRSGRWPGRPSSSRCTNGQRRASQTSFWHDSTEVTTRKRRAEATRACRVP